MTQALRGPQRPSGWYLNITAIEQPLVLLWVAVSKDPSDAWLTYWRFRQGQGKGPVKGRRFAPEMPHAHKVPLQRSTKPLHRDITCSLLCPQVRAISSLWAGLVSVLIVISVHKDWIIDSPARAYSSTGVQKLTPLFSL